MSKIKLMPENKITVVGKFYIAVCIFTLCGKIVKITAVLVKEILQIVIYSTDTREGIMLESCLDFLITNPTLCDYEQM